MLILASGTLGNAIRDRGAGPLTPEPWHVLAWAVVAAVAVVHARRDADVQADARRHTAAQSWAD